MLNIIHEALILKIKKAVNATLQELISLNPEISARLGNLDNKSLSIKVLAFPFDFQHHVLFNNNKINIAFDQDSNADLNIKLAPGSLIRAKILGVDRVLRTRDIELTGDLSLAMELQKLMSDVDLNFKDKLQEKLIELTSDHFAWQVINILEKVSERISIKSAELNEQVADYLHTEKKIVVSKIELEYFYQDVDQLQNDVARLSSRISEITNR